MKRFWNGIALVNVDLSFPEPVDDLSWIIGFPDYLSSLCHPSRLTLYMGSFLGAGQAKYCVRSYVLLVYWLSYSRVWVVSITLLAPICFKPISE
jgi:hypothetical protein